MKASKATIDQKLNPEISALLAQSKMKKYGFSSTKSVTYDEFLSNKMFIIAPIRSGIPYTLFDLIRNFTPFSDKDWANFLNISTKSLNRYKSSVDFYFKPIHFEKIIEMAGVINIGLYVFGNIEKLKLWINTPNFALGNLQSIDLLKDSYGKELVVSELVRVNHEIFI